MMIEDEELRMTFQFASEDHLQKLDEGLLYLEQHPDDREKIAEMLREAHSLKGDAGMLGVKDVATLAHQWEHLLGTLKDGETPFNADICDRLYSGLDAIRKLVNEAITGEPSGVNTFYVLAQLMGAKSGSESTENTESQTEASTTASESASAEASASAETSFTQASAASAASETPVASAASEAVSSMMIDDEELRMTFQFASEDHLQKLDEGLLYLEQHPKDPEKLAEMLREAHSLKGDAANVGRERCGHFGASMGAFIRDVEGWKPLLTMQIFCDRLYSGLDAIRTLVNEAVTGEPSGVNTLPMSGAQLMRGRIGSGVYRKYRI
jgi:two-component system chemotaxis sensor kinase CheA